jgi:hypothetical protein
LTSTTAPPAAAGRRSARAGGCWNPPRPGICRILAGPQRSLTGCAAEITLAGGHAELDPDLAELGGQGGIGPLHRGQVGALIELRRQQDAPAQFGDR